MPKEMKRNKVPPSIAMAQEDQLMEHIMPVDDQPLKTVLLSYIERLSNTERVAFWNELEQRGFIT